MNPLHSSASECWGTPIDVIELARLTMGSIDLDPASDWQFNQNVKATYHINKEINGLSTPWPSECNIFLNPPGGKQGKYSNMVLFWQKLMQERMSMFFNQAIFVAFSLEALQTTQRVKPSICNFPMCIPSKRMRFIDANGNVGPSPTHGNVIVYVHGCIDRTLEFSSHFSSLGAIILPKR